MGTEIIIKNIDQVIFEKLKIEADRQGTDLTTLIVQLIAKSLGIKQLDYADNELNDLDSLAGTWTEKEYSDFASNTLMFNEIDEYLWK